MTPIEKQEQFKTELEELFEKYKAEITLEDFGKACSVDEKIVVNFAYDESLQEENGTGIIPDLILGRYFSY